jgi:hypothetical protein
MAKGGSIVGLVKLARSNREGFASVLSPEVRAFIETRILVGSWYPESYHRDLLIAADRVSGKGDLATCRLIGKAGARAALSGVYKAYLIPGDVQGTILQFPVFWPMFHDSGRCNARIVPPNTVRIEIDGFGLPSPALCLTQLGWIEGLAEEAGGRCEVDEEQCAARGAPSCVYLARWFKER